MDTVHVYLQILELRLSHLILGIFFFLMLYREAYIFY